MNSMIHIQKKPQSSFRNNDIVCFCFGYSKKDIIEDFINNNNLSTILEKIKTEKQSDGCECKTKNPKGV